jgi:hypothetical protein
LTSPIAVCEAAVDVFAVPCAWAVARASGAGGGWGVDFPTIGIPLRHHMGYAIQIPMSYNKGTLEERFWQKVDKDDEASCWEWRATKNNMGYGMLHSKSHGRKILAHRVSYEIHNPEPIQEGMIVQHRCDNPGCVNPVHLELGTMKTNYHDMVAKGRRKIAWNPTNIPPHYEGSAHPSSKLTEQNAIAIRERVANGESRRALSREYLIDRKTIYDLLRRKIWRHV